jgi:prepilin peptidase CpaA
MIFEYFIIALLCGVIALSLVVSVYDFKYRRIPNIALSIAIAYTLCVFILMIFFVSFSIAAKGFLYGLLGAMAAGVFLFLPYKYKQVGAGDVKLVIVFGLLLGFKGVMLSILFGAMFGGVWALGLAWWHGGLTHLWYNIKFMARSLYLSGFKEMSWDLRSEGAIAMPYGVALSAGAVLIASEQLLLHVNRLMNLS